MTRQSFANLPSPVLAGVIRERTARDAAAEIRNCEYHGADAIDLHISCLHPEYQTVEALRSVISQCAKPILALHYAQDYENNLIDITEADRTALLLRAADAGAAAVDIQGYTFDPASRFAFRGTTDGKYPFTVGNPREVVMDTEIIDRQCALIEEIHGRGAEVLLSTHTGVFMNTEQVVSLALFLEKRNPDIIKIVTPCENEEQLAVSFGTMIALKKEVRTKIHYHCSGKAGKLSRIVNPMLGAHLCFCFDRFSASSNLEQLDLQTARSVIDGLKKLM